MGDLLVAASLLAVLVAVTAVVFMVRIERRHQRYMQGLEKALAIRQEAIAALLAPPRHVIPPPPRKARERAQAKGWLLATGALAAGLLMVIPSFTPTGDLEQQPPPIALPPGRTGQPPSLEPRPELPTTEPMPEPDTLEDTVPDAGQSDAAPETTNTPDPPVVAAQAPEGGGDSDPDAAAPPPEQEPEPREPPPEEPEPSPGPSPEPDCSIIHVDLQPTVEACLLPE